MVDPELARNLERYERLFKDAENHVDYWLATPVVEFIEDLTRLMEEKNVSRAERSAACAASTSGLERSASMTRSLSAGEWNSIHHCPGTSMLVRKRCASPPGTLTEAVCGGRLP